MERFPLPSGKLSESEGSQLAGFYVFREGIRIARPNMESNQLELYRRNGIYDQSESMTANLAKIKDITDEYKWVVQFFDKHDNWIGVVPASEVLGHE